MKRILSALLALLMLGTAMTACGGNDSPAQSNETTAADTQQADTAETTAAETELTDGLPEKDMDGFTLTILHYNQKQLSWVNHQLMAEAENGDLVNDAVYKRNREIEERFGAKLNIVEVDAPGTTMANAVLAGETTYDIVLQSGANIISNIQYLSDFGQLDYIDFEGQHWNPDASGMFLIGGKRLAAAGNFVLAYLTGTSCTMFNKDLKDSLGIEDNFYKMVLDGKWTVDEFYRLARLAIADLNGDGAMTRDDRFGALGTTSMVYHGSLITGAGFKYVNHNKDGYPEFTMPDDEKMMSFVLEMLDIRINEPYLFYTESTSSGSSDTYVLFEKGQSLFLSQFVKRIQDYRGMDIDFGILPNPKYDEAQENYYGRTAIGEASTLPKTVDTARYENIGILLEALAFHSQHNLLEDYKEVLLKTKLARDDDSAAMLDYVFNGMVFDIGMVVSSSTMDTVVGGMFFNKTNTLASTMASMETQADAAIEKIIQTVEESMK